jgi:hypothetical protein
MALEDCLELGVDHAGQCLDHGNGHRLPELGHYRPFQPLLAVPGAVTGARTLRAELTERLARAMLAGAETSPYPTALA